MFSYKTAVAFRKKGYTNIKIYNGGIKDWQKNGYQLDSQAGLPHVKIKFITASQLLEKLNAADKACHDQQGNPVVTLLDFRNEIILEKEGIASRIKTQCRTLHLMLDDLLSKETIRQIPKQGLLVTITETGNRDPYAIQYLSQYGFETIQALEFGMRGWIKNRYPIESLK